MKTTPAITPITTFPGRLISKIPLPSWMTWLILWEIVFLIDYLYSINIPGGHDHIAAFGVISLFFASVCITVMYCASVLTRLYPDLVQFIDTPEPELRNWYWLKLHRAYEGIWPVLAGILFVVAEELTIGDLVKSYTPDENIIQGLRTGYRIAGFFFLGVSLWALLSMLLIPMQLIRFKIKVSLNQLSGHGLQAFGAAFFKMSIAITLSYALIVFTAVGAGVGGNLSILIWESIGALLIFSFFLLPQIGIHRIMSHEKDQRIISFSHHLEEALEKSLKDPSSENMQRLKELFELQGHLKNMNEWPFNVNTLWQLISALLIPLLLAVLEIIF